MHESDRLVSRLSRVLADSRPRVLDGVIRRAREHGYSRVAATQPEFWAMACDGLATGVVEALRTRSEPEPPGPDGPPEPPGEGDRIAGFVVREARRHRARGVPLAYFLGLLKDMRAAFRDVIAGACDPAEADVYLEVLDRAFDRFEIGAAADWERSDADRRLQEHRAEARIQTDEKARYMTIVDSLPVAVMLLDSEGRLHLLNRAAAAAFLPEDSTTAGVGAWARPADVIPDLIPDLQAFEKDEATELSIERQVATPIGRRWFQVRLRRTVDVTERFLGTIIILNDIEERRVAEESLRLAHAELDRRVRERTAELARAKEALETVIRHSPLPMVVVDGTGHVLVWNPAAERTFGWSSADVIGQPIPFASGPDGPGFRAALAEVMGAGLAAPSTFEWHRKDGTVLHVDAFLSPLRGPSGVVEGFIAVLRDMTAEREAQRVLRESEERYRTLVELSPDPIIVHQDGKLVFANRAAAQLVGAADPSELIGRDALDFVHPDDRELVRSRVAAMLAGRRVPPAIEVFLRLDGTPVEVEVSAAAFPFRNRLAIQVFAHDVTERRAAEQTMRRQAEELAASEAALRAFRDIDREMVQHLYPDDVLRAVLARIPPSLGADAVAVSLLVDDGEKVVSTLTRTVSGDIIEEELVALDPAALAEVIRDQTPLVVQAIVSDPRVRVVAPWEGAAPAAYIAMPLVVRGRTTGVLHVVATRAGAFMSPAVVEAFQSIAWRIAIGLENARAFEDTTHRAEVVELLLSARLGERADVATVTTDALGVLARSCGTDRAGFFRHEQSSGRLTLDAHCGLSPMEAAVWRQRLAFSVGEERGLVGLVASTRERLYVPDTALDPRWIEVDPSVRSAYFVPIVAAGRLYGVVNILGRRPYAFHSGQRALADLFAHHLGTMMEGARLLEQTRQAEQRFRSIFENAVEGIYQRDAGGRLVAANPALARMLGYAGVEDLLRDTRDTGVVLHGSLARDQEFMRLVLEHGVVRTFECQARRRDGTPVWLSENARAVRGANGAVVRVEGVVEDVTERKDLERQLHQAQRMEAVGRLAGGVAHDFNNLLTAIMGYSALLMDRIPAGDPLRREVDEIWNAGKRASSLTGQLLAFSRRQVLQPQPLDLNAIVRGIEAMLRRLIGEDVRLETDLAEGLGRVLADRGQVEQVIVNLAVNARDAMLEGGVLRLKTANRDLTEPLEGGDGTSIPPGRWIELSAIDTGCGMDAETRAHVFEPFFTTKSPGKGTGLGLAVVYGIVKQSGGFIFVRSEPGKGAEFRIFLPRTDAEGDGQPDARPRPALARGSETVLVVEDEDAVRGLATTVLSRSGYRVLEARDGFEALDIASRPGQIDLLLTDVVMPGMNGRELASQVLRMRPNVKVIYTSGYTDGDAMFLGLVETGALFLQKPFEPARLAQVVREQLEKR